MEQAAPSCLRPMRSNQVWLSSQVSEDRANQQFAMGRTGIEPVTLGLKVPCSTN